LFKKLINMGLLENDSSFDDVLELSIDDISKRRLASMVVSKGLARSPKQARQFITHKHVFVGGKKVSSPNYVVLRDEENSIVYAMNSPFNDKNHPLIEQLKKSGKEVEKVKEDAKN